MQVHRKVAYDSGQERAMEDLGLPSAETFAQMVEADSSPQEHRAAPPEVDLEDKPVHWGGGASLEGGDSGTRQEQMGLPSSGGV